MPGTGLLHFFVRHPTAANLLMALIILLGVFALDRHRIQFFPDFGIDQVLVEVEWPGSSAGDVDSTIVQAIEPEVRFLDGVKRVVSSSVEGRAFIAIEFHAGTDMGAALSNVETGVGQVTTLPEDSLKPVIRRAVRYDTIARLIVSGPYSEAALKAIAKRIRDGLLSRGIQKVDLFGARDEEIWVEIKPETLLRLDLKLSEIAARIRETSQDLPSGSIRGASEKQIRSLGLIKEAGRLGEVEVKALPGGQKVLLRDIAAITERFDVDDPQARRRFRPAIEIHVRRAVNADALDQAEIMDSTLAGLQGQLPPDLAIEKHAVAADLIKGRINLLLRNGLTGLVLVVMVLFVFLDSRVAFWVAAGIPISLMATLVVMLATGQSINMISLFGVIMAIGIVVDEAIVVGEHGDFQFRSGLAPLAAAEAGATRMAAPVMSSALTTIAAFTPLLVIGDIIGVIIAAIPLVVIAMIASSVLECFFILPAHLRGAFAKAGVKRHAMRERFDRGFQRLRDGVFGRIVGIAVDWRYTTLALALAALLLSIGLIQGGRVNFQFFPTPEADRIHANVQMSAGTPRARTQAMLDELERAALAAEEALTGGQGGLIHVTLSKIGTRVRREGAVPSSGDNIGGVTLELTPSDQRPVRTREMIAQWRESVAMMAGVESLTIVGESGGPPGREIDIRLRGRDTRVLKAVAKEVKGLLARYPGVSDVEDNLPYGKAEEILRVTPRGRALGFTTQSVARQVRDAFQGAIARRFARGDEEVLVRVLHPRGAADTAALDSLYLRAPGGAEVALSAVVTREAKRGFSQIRRENGVREVAVTGEIDEAVASSNKVLAALEKDGIRDIAARQGVQVRFAGKAEEQSETLADMKKGAAIGLVMIYIILAWVFASFTRPAVVMAIIPFGLIGAVMGHWILGFDLTILSLIALVGLAGILVNDSIILVTTIDERIGAGEPLRDAIVHGSRDRLRAVILTSATTIGGLTPLMFERSFQAQFLIPMALTITFGLLVATLLVLVVVPALIAVQDDLAKAFSWLSGGGKARAMEGRMP
ncbi:MAG: efflux RND transporter permease subunit [Alphaproteobacteria bacterium]